MLTGTPEGLHIGKSTLKSLNFTTVYTSSAVGLPPGPYFLHGPNLHQAWRLYQDYLDAFIFGVVPENALKPERLTLIDWQNYMSLELRFCSGSIH